MKPILKIVNVDVCGPHALSLVFNDGTSRRVDVHPLLVGPVFRPLRDPEFFARVALDAVTGTVVWPNGVDLAPEALRELPDQGDGPSPAAVA